MKNFLIGCSAYNNRYWTGVFYPEDLPRSKWFEFYCTQFNTYEINGSFYKFPTAKSLSTWHKKSPEGFIFAVKAPKYISHIKRFDDCTQQMADFYAACRDGLQEKLGCTLFQIPASFQFSPENLQSITSLLDPTFKNVIEFRHESWWNDEVFASLSKHRITFCNVSYPKLPEKLIKTTDIGYMRFHGVPRLFYSGYGLEKLEDYHRQLRSMDFSEVNIYFNNTAGVEGILDTIEMRDIASKK